MACSGIIFLPCFLLDIDWDSLPIPKFSCSTLTMLPPQSVHWGINILLKNTTPSFSPSHPLNLQNVQVSHLFRNFPLYIGFL